MSLIPLTGDNKKLKVVFVGAHPDDAEIHFGGTALKYKKLNHDVTIISMTDGSAGHHVDFGDKIAQRRKKETQNIENEFGFKYIIMDNPDGRLSPTVEIREELIKIIRQEKPDVVVTHRTSDYHADHRATALLVQDLAYLISVPGIVPDIQRLENNPVILFHNDNFSYPKPFVPHIIVDITDVFEMKIKAIARHESQVFEWLPFVEKYLDEIPEKYEDRLEFLKEKWGNYLNVKRHLDILRKSNSSADYLEAFEISEYGGRIDKSNYRQYMPFGVWGV